MEEQLSKKVFINYQFLLPAFTSAADAINKIISLPRTKYKSIPKNLTTSATASSDLKANLTIGDINHV